MRSLAARVPPELFDDILFYVNVNRASRRREKRGNYLIRTGGKSRLEYILSDLKHCSLVCLFWANRCREYMFSGATLRIECYEGAEKFKQYFVRGCSRLTPVHQFIREIQVRQHYKSQRSFLHLLYLPAIQDKITQITIQGPVPDSFNHAKLDTPHWDIPPRIVVPTSFLRKKISIIHLHLPSFCHATKYIRHFACACYIKLKEITWDGETPYTQAHVPSTVIRQRRPRSLRIRATRSCTNSFHLALTALMMNPNCPLHWLSEEGRVWMIRFMTLLWGHEKEPDVDVSEYHEQ